MTRSALRRRLKRAGDVALCVVTLPITAPVMGVLALAVKATSPGPVIYRAKRMGRDGEVFELFKFRTMTAGSAGPGVTRSGDLRITSVGRWLRAGKLDELPQILNVLRGEMSVVGPRPEDPRYLHAYTEEQRAVLTVAPGMTSAALFHFGNEQAFIERACPDDVEAFYLAEILPVKLAIELHYVREWGLRRDLGILARTVGAMFT
ncbi:sugar transferase [Actinomycetospora rhizophila]|uniref:Sugar transferase n=1 Tax=Actinomycetospora rhizophila TaxID=1416876 RepID=A0ABV9ZKY4_9PSEU